MGEMRSAAQFQDIKMWADTTKAKAKELQISCDRICADLFSSGDFQVYLDLVCRLNCYDARNLLLIMLQFPQATCLAGFKLWQKQLDNPNAQVLKPEWRGKGIDLVAPFMEYLGEGNFALTWFAIKQFDISQTNVTDFEVSPPVYIKDDKHLQRLINSVKGVIGSEYHKSVFEIPSTAELRAAKLSGQITERTVELRNDLKPTQKLEWLVSCLCSFAMESNLPFSPAQYDFAQRCIVHCLYTIWGVPEPSVFRQSAHLTSAIKTNLQLEFLNLIQRTVRHIEESVSHVYSLNRGDIWIDSG